MTSDESPFLTYEVRLSEPAEADIDVVLLQLSLLSPAAAERWHNGLLVASQSLSQLPRRCPLAPENDFFNREIRQLIFQSGRIAYRILFTIFEATEEDGPAFIRIMRVLHGAQQRLGPSQNA